MYKLDRTKSNADFFQGLTQVNRDKQREALLRKEFECIGHLLFEGYDNETNNSTEKHDIEGELIMVLKPPQNWNEKIVDLDMSSRN